MFDQPIAIVDVETTGSTATQARVLELGVIRVENGQVVDHLSQILDPEESVPDMITRITGLETADTVGQPKFGQVNERLMQLLDGAIFVAHNVDFDYGFIRQEFKRLGINYESDRLCSVQLSRRLYPQAKKHSLEAIIQRHQLTAAERHRALADAEMVWQFMQQALADHGAVVFESVWRKLMRPLSIRRISPKASPEVEYLPMDF